MRYRQFSVVAGVALAVAALVGCSAEPTPAVSTAPGADTVQEFATDAADPAAPGANPSGSSAVAPLLTYLVEEEKLAHDLYVLLGDTWGTRIFDNIAASETTHEDAVAGLLDDYGVPDPRVDTLGVFVDPQLQALYDQLAASGTASYAGAIAAGITVEETDIADLERTIADSPADVQVVLDRLLAASNKHLAAFTRQA